MLSAKIIALEHKIISLGIDVGSANHPVSSRINAAKKCCSSGENETACLHACYVQFLLEDLEIIKGKNKALYKHFIRLLRLKNLSMDNYFGIRFEIRTAASLITKQINFHFQKNESPDFIINNPLFGIECTSGHLDINKNLPPKKVFYKVLSVINKKNTVTYSTKKNILALDVSNLIYHEGRDISLSILADMDKSRPLIEDEINKSKFLGLIYFYYRWRNVSKNKKETRILLSSSYVRVYGKRMPIKTKKFLDQFFPKGDIWEEASVGEFV
jgi:hypothetical protein